MSFVNQSQSPTPSNSHRNIDDDPGVETYRTIDRMQEATLGRMTGGLSPAAIALAFCDWTLHLAAAPGKRMELAEKGWRTAAQFGEHLMNGGSQAPSGTAPVPGDHRFDGDHWDKRPYATMTQAFLLTQQWWQSATRAVPGVGPHNEEVVSFATRQILDMFSPSNNPFTNPKVIDKTIETGGRNLVEGFQNYIADFARQAASNKPVGAEDFVPGKNVAVTPGKVVFRNHLIELIQYAPQTEEVLAEPILIVPAWIMKYYILDLSPENSLIRYLVSRGHTVFCISWRNPDEEDRDLTMDDYRKSGVMAAVDAISVIAPERKIHAAGYCLGGTLLSIAAAAMGRARDDRLASVTLLAAQTDFTEPGELALFIDHSQMNLLESMMWDRGYLSADQMAGAFQMLRSNDLVWSHLVQDYLMGERTPMIDLMAWNADTTRMPYRMHAEYLEKLYINNQLAGGHFMVDGRPAVLENIRLPLFVVGTEKDHVAPWRSVYKIHLLTDTDTTFVLTSGGHNAGIVSEPGHPHRHYRIAQKNIDDPLLGPEEWAASAPSKEGSWWEAWSIWLTENSSSERVGPPKLSPDAEGSALLCDAPGVYVFQQ